MSQLLYWLSSRGLCPEGLYFWWVDREIRRSRPAGYVESDKTISFVTTREIVAGETLVIEVERGRAQEAEWDST